MPRTCGAEAGGGEGAAGREGTRVGPPHLVPARLRRRRRRPAPAAHAQQDAAAPEPVRRGRPAHALRRQEGERARGRGARVPAPRAALTRVSAQVLSADEYACWLQRHLEAEAAVDNREQLLFESAARLETNLHLLGNAPALVSRGPASRWQTGRGPDSSGWQLCSRSAWFRNRRPETAPHCVVSPGPSGTGSLVSPARAAGPPLEPRFPTRNR